MDIRQIQALHAQYTQQAVVIDIGGHEAAMPVLPAPECGSRRGWKLHAMPAKFRKVGRPALLCVAIAVLAGGGGMTAAKIWRVMHDSVAAPARPLEQFATASAQGCPASESATYFAPARPLTSADFGQQPATASVLASVDARSLSINAPKAGSAGGKPSDSATDSTLARAAVSSIHAQRPAVAVQPVVASTITPTPTQPATVASAAPTASTALPSTQAQPNAAPVTTPAIVRAARTAEAPAPKPALRPIRHVTSHHAASTAAEAPSTPAATQRSAPADAATKGGDVQLF